MIRFRCLHCDKSLKVPDEKGGAAVVCPRCGERCVAPATAGVEAGEGLSRRSGRTSGVEAGACTSGAAGPSLFAGMSPRVRGGVILVAGVGLLSLVLAVLASPLGASPERAATAFHWAVVLVPACAVLLLVMLHGHATSCPACGRWWAREKVETEFVDREVFEKGGVPFARSTYRTSYRCGSCKHNWWVAFTDEYKEFVRHRLNQRSG